MFTYLRTNFGIKSPISLLMYTARKRAKGVGNIVHNENKLNAEVMHT